ncbi:MAG TPA: glycerophosphodiester phosphodiesterase [Candidatus Saccharimonadales bacterium]|jgi:glycerophosphoryl diester phosphodiesterase
MKIIGHRGAAGLAPENTLAALEAGIAAGADILEFDVRVTSDNIPVLSHDRFATKGQEHLLIGSNTYAQLKSCNPLIARLDEALNRIGTRAVPMIEVKAHELTGPIVTVLKEFVGSTYTPGQVQLGSKSQRTLNALHAALPDVPKVVIEPWSGVRAVVRARILGTKHISMRSWWLWGGFLDAMQKRGYLMAAYTLNDPAKARRWEKYLDAVITDFPDRYRDTKPS